MPRLLAVPALGVTLWFGLVGCGETVSLGSGPNRDAAADATSDRLVGGIGGSPGGVDAVKGTTDADENELIVRGGDGGTDTPPVAGVTDASARPDSTD